MKFSLIKDDGQKKASHFSYFFITSGWDEVNFLMQLPLNQLGCRMPHEKIQRNPFVPKGLLTNFDIF
jgi:hypothetical protein